MTDDYIKRKDALTGLEDSGIGLYDDEPIQTRNSALKIIQNIPAADVAPVVHGRWVDSKLDGVPSHCSECNYPIGRFYKTHFCPNCGAKMEVQDEV